MAKGAKKAVKKSAKKSVKKPRGKKPAAKPAKKSSRSKWPIRSANSQRDADLARVHMLLMSGNEERFKEAREIIKLYPNDAHFLAASLEDMTKTWIENNRAVDDDGRKVKKREYLKAMFKIGRRVLNGLPQEDWYQRAEVARAFRYSGHFAKARIQFTKAMRKMEELGDEQGENHAKVLAEAAEFWAYLGYTGKALEILARIKPANAKPWHLWVKAFILHQAAFTDLYEIGEPAEPYGDIARYREANDAIIAARKGIIGKEADDTYLLEAANWGGIANRLEQLKRPRSEIDAAIAEAGSRMENFRNNPNARVNKFWSLQKETRGLIPQRYLNGIDAPATEAEEAKIAEWRKHMATCYKQNLKTASLDPIAKDPPSAFEDGEPPEDKEQDDDE